MCAGGAENTCGEEPDAGECLFSGACDNDGDCASNGCFFQPGVCVGDSTTPCSVGIHGDPAFECLAFGDISCSWLRCSDNTAQACLAFISPDFAYCGGATCHGACGESGNSCVFGCETNVCIPDEVASEPSAFGGRLLLATGEQATALGGERNRALGSGVVTSGGLNNTASSLLTTTVGGAATTLAGSVYEIGPDPTNVAQEPSGTPPWDGQ